MRMIRMQKVWKKIGAFVLALALVVPLLCGAQITARADEPQEVSDYFILKIQSEGCSRYKSGNLTGLQKDDIVTVSLVANQNIASVRDISGYIHYDTKKFRAPTNDKIVSNLAGWDVGWWPETGKFQVIKTDSSGELIKANEVILEMTFVVKYDVQDETAILLGGLTEADPIYFCNSTLAYHHDPVSITLKNSETAERKLNITVSGNDNNDATGGTLLVSTNMAEENQKAQIAIKVDNESKYNGFKIAYTYDTTVLSPYKKGTKEIPYELSDAAKAYVNVVQYNTTYQIVNGTRMRTDWISILASYNINLSGDFLYLNFQMGNTSLVANNASVRVQLYGASNDSNTSIAYGITNKTGLERVDDSSLVYVEADPSGGLIDVPYKMVDIKYVDRLVDYGDVNGDGKVNLIDATMVLQYYNGVRGDLTQDQFNRADVDQSGRVNLVDVLFIMKYYNGAISSLPVK